MGQVLSIADFKRREKVVFFDRHELSKLLNLYSRRVISGDWHDYAIDHDGRRVIFSVFRNAARVPVFSVAKERMGNGDRYVVTRGWRKVSRLRSLEDAIRTLEREFKVLSSREA